VNDFSHKYNKKINEIDIIKDNKIEKHRISEITRSSQNNAIMSLELHITSKNTYTETEKNILIKKYGINVSSGYGNFSFSKNKIRFFLHAINIIVFDGKVQLGQSWKCLQEYHLYHNKKAKRIGKWLLYLVDMAKTNPLKLFDEFDKTYLFTDKKQQQVDNIKKIVSIISQEKIDCDIEMPIRYIIL
jgi:hypothetical protein